MWVVEWLTRGTIAGSLWLSESSGKTFNIVRHSFSNSFSMKGGARILDVSWVKCQRSMSLISLLVLTSTALTLEFSAVTFAVVKGT